MTADAERDPVNVLGELIEDCTVRYGGRIGTLASARVAEEVIERLRADEQLVARIVAKVPPPDCLECGQPVASPGCIPTPSGPGHAVNGGVEAGQ